MASPIQSPFRVTDEALMPVLHELAPREPIFHRPATASSLDDFARLMAPEYWEVGASGRRYSRAFILEHLARHPPVDADNANWQTSGFACGALGPETFLLTYTLHQEGRKTRRATLWQRTFSGWQILYHQGAILKTTHKTTSSQPKPGCLG